MSELLSTAEFDEPLADRQERPAALIPPTDGERLMRFQHYRDESAFAEVVEAHAKMVWGVCAQILRHQQDIEDAFQATFLILARKATSIRAADNAAGWLYRVAFRTALLARDRRNRRNEAPLVDDPRSLDDQLAAVERSEQCFALLEELNALPARYRQPLVLCYMEGRTRREAADELGVTSQTVKGLLARGTRMLRSRLVRRGTALSIAMGAATAAMAASQAAATPTLVSATAALGASFAMKAKFATSGLKGSALQGAACTLAEKGLLAMTIAAASKPAVGLLGICLAVGMLTAADAEPTATLRLGVAPTVLYLATDGGKGAAAGSEEFTAVADGVQDVLLTAATEGDEEGFAGAAERTKGVNSDAGKIAVEFDYLWKEKEAKPALPAKKAIPAGQGRGRGMAAANKLVGTAVVSEAGGMGMGTYQAALPALPGQPSMVVAQSSAWNQVGPAATISASQGASAATLKLEQEYWDLKAQGLKKKAEALQAKYEVASKVKDGVLSASEILELAAERDLTLAEVKLCEMNLQRVKESLPAEKLVAVELKSGAVGEEVKALQQTLNIRIKSAQPPLTVDGHFGPMTEERVKRFQRDHGITANGIVGAETWKAIGVFEAEPAAPLGSVSIRHGELAPPTPPSATIVAPAPNPYRSVAASPAPTSALAPAIQYGTQAQPIMVTQPPQELIDKLTELATANKQLTKRLEQLEREAKEADAKSK